MRKTNLAIDFPWSKGNAYEIIVPRGSRSKDPLSAPHVREAVISQKGKACDDIRPLKVHNNLYLEFVRLDGSAVACAAFAAIGATAKRIMAKFCSDECRKRFHYEHRRVK